MTTRINGRFRDDLRIAGTVLLSIGIVLTVFLIGPMIGGAIGEWMVNGA